ncbi:MAG: YdeI/OmpD-associated family protein [Pseudomonadota bacterium]
MADAKGIKTENFEKVEVASADELRGFLLENHAQEPSVWLVTYKKIQPDKYVSTGEVLDELLAFGWVDGIRRKLDDERTMQLIGPRRSQHWSKTYKDRAAKLEEEGRMHDAGRAAIARSKKEGLWDFLNDVDALIKPDDLVEELQRKPPALEVFDAFGPAVQRFALREVKLAKTPETRAKRIDDISTRAQNGQKPKGT